jgi:hypothetical protein
MRTVGLCLVFICLGAALTQTVDLSTQEKPEWKRFVAERYLAYKSVFPVQSAQTQASLDKLIKEAAANKNQAVIDLNQKKGDPFLAKLFKNGLTSYTSTATVEAMEGIDADMLTEFSNYLADSLKIAAGARRDFMDQMSISAFADKNDWKEFAFIFKLNAGTAKYVSVLSVLDSKTNTLDFLVCDIKSGFELAPDVIISTHTKSSFFGLFKSTKVVITRRPAELTMESIELLFKFFKVSALEKFALYRNIK